MSTRAETEDSVGAHPVLRGIVGQPRAQAMLSRFVDSPVHAYLFVGPAGSGKRAAARAFAAALLCPNGGCGECATCRGRPVGPAPRRRRRRAPRRLDLGRRGA